MDDFQIKRSLVEDTYRNTYEPRVETFCNEEISEIAKGYDSKSGKGPAPAPFFPVIGSGYYDSSIRVAIYGMETSYWYNLHKFINIFKDSKNSLAAVKAYTDGIEGDNTTYKNRFNNHHALVWYKEHNYPYTFWRFAFSTLAGIHGLTEEELLQEENLHLLKSFIWGNVNSYEKFGASCKKKGVKKKDWQQIYNAASKLFNSAQLLLPYTRPQIMVVFYWKMSRKWLTGKKGDWQINEKQKICWRNFFEQHKELSEEQQKKIKHYFRFYYLEETGTSVLHTMHPNGMNPHFKYWKGNGMDQDIWKAAINYAIQYIMKKNNISSLR